MKKGFSLASAGFFNLINKEIDRMNKTYGPHATKTFEIQLEHHGYDVEEMREMSSEDRVNNTVEAAYQIKDWFRVHFVKIYTIEVGLRILAALKGGAK
jgi:hypothetical protein